MNGTKIYLSLSVLLWLPYGLFCVFQPGEELHNWKSAGGRWSIKTANGTVDVRVSATELSVQNREARYGWIIPFQRKSDD